MKVKQLFYFKIIILIFSGTEAFKLSGNQMPSNTMTDDEDILNPIEGSGYKNTENQYPMGPIKTTIKPSTKQKNSILIEPELKIIDYCDNSIHACHTSYSSCIVDKTDKKGYKCDCMWGYCGEFCTVSCLDSLDQTNFEIRNYGADEIINFSSADPNSEQIDSTIGDIIEENIAEGWQVNLRPDDDDQKSDVSNDTINLDSKLPTDANPLSKLSQVPYDYEDIAMGEQFPNILDQVSTEIPEIKFDLEDKKYEKDENLDGTVPEFTQFEDFPTTAENNFETTQKDLTTISPPSSENTKNTTIDSIINFTEKFSKSNATKNNLTPIIFEQTPKPEIIEVTTTIRPELIPLNVTVVENTNIIYTSSLSSSSSSINNTTNRNNNNENLNTAKMQTFDFSQVNFSETGNKIINSLAQFYCIFNQNQLKPITVSPNSTEIIKIVSLNADENLICSLKWAGSVFLITAFLMMIVCFYGKKSVAMRDRMNDLSDDEYLGTSLRSHKYSRGEQ